MMTRDKLLKHRVKFYENFTSFFDEKWDVCNVAQINDPHLLLWRRE